MTTYTNTQSNTQDSRYQNRNKYTESRQSYPGSSITYVRNSAIEKSACSHTLVGCNTQGQMQYGLAGAMSRMFPEILGNYKAACQAATFIVGSARVARTRKAETTLVLLGIWRLQEFAATIEWIEASLRRVSNALMDGKIVATSLATVKLGCGGPQGLDWAIVGPVMAQWLGTLGIPVEIYVGHDDLAYFPVLDEKGVPTTITLKAGEVAVADLEGDNL